MLHLPFAGHVNFFVEQRRPVDLMFSIFLRRHALYMLPNAVPALDLPLCDIWTLHVLTCFLRLIETGYTASKFAPSHARKSLVRLHTLPVS
jgi:hypothetical protein